MWVCFGCTNTFPILKLLRRHINQMHNVKNLTVFRCGQQGCYREYASLKSLYNHYSDVHMKLEEIIIHNEPSCSVDDTAPCIEKSTVNESESEPESDEASEALCNFDKEELFYILKLYQINNINRGNVIDIIKANKDLAETKGLGHCFQNLDSEFLIIKALKSLNLWNEPVEIVVKYEEAISNIDGSSILQHKPVKVPILKLSKSFEIFFSTSDRLESAATYMTNRSNTWNDVKDVQIFPPNTFPYVLYYDEMESGNPLGSHKGTHKVGMVYASLRCLPPHTYSKLENIFFCFLYHVKTWQKYRLCS